MPCKTSIHFVTNFVKIVCVYSICIENKTGTETSLFTCMPYINWTMYDYSNYLIDLNKTSDRIHKSANNKTEQKFSLIHALQAKRFICIKVFHIC